MDLRFMPPIMLVVHAAFTNVSFKIQEAWGPQMSSAAGNSIVADSIGLQLSECYVLLDGVVDSSRPCHFSNLSVVHSLRRKSWETFAKICTNGLSVTFKAVINCHGRRTSYLYKIRDLFEHLMRQKKSWKVTQNAIRWVILPVIEPDSRYHAVQ